MAQHARAYAPSIDAPGEAVSLDRDHEGDIACATLLVHPGVTVRGGVDAARIVVRGHLEGPVRADELVVAEGASYEGEANVDALKVAGGVSGLLVAQKFLAKSSASVEGCLIVDSFGMEPGASMRATVISERGASLDTRRLAEARAELGRSKSIVGARPAEAFVEPVRDAIPVADARRPVIAQVPAAPMAEPAPARVDAARPAALRPVLQAEDGERRPGVPFLI